jgi:hypothetical protein
MTGAHVSSWSRDDSGAWQHLALVYPPMAQRSDARFRRGAEASKSSADMWLQLVQWTQVCAAGRVIDYSCAHVSFPVFSVVFCSLLYFTFAF